MAHAYPLMLDVVNRPVVIVGGGNVAVRKAQGLLAAGATRVTVVSPMVHEAMPAGVQRLTEEYRAEHLRGAGLVFAATDNPRINDAVVNDAHALGLPVARADTDEETPGDFSTPAMLREGPLIVTVSTQGSPALAAMIRDELRGRLDPRWAAMAEAMQILRPRLLAAEIEPAQRRRIFRELASPDLLQLCADGDVEAIWNWVITRHPELNRRA